jgi:D-alanyl-D-alanine carboxypeptidase/D-alanyl-D-alanine-endopeptidase (penicillin-binding protein 4)
MLICVTPAGTRSKIGSESVRGNKKNGFRREISSSVAAWACAAVVLVAGYGTTVADSTLVRVRDLLLQNKYSLSQVSFILKEIGIDSSYVSLNADTLRNPASVAKLVTAAIALDRLGLFYTFKTQLFAPGRLNRGEGVLDGDLYIHGGGDPTFTAQRMWLLVRHINMMGIKTVRGDVVLDDSWFDTVSIGPGFSEDQSCRSYEAPVGALSANFNSIEIYQAPGDSVSAPVHIAMLPPNSRYEIGNRSATVASGKPRTLDVRTGLNGLKVRISVEGDLPIEAKPKFSYRKVWHTWENFGGVVRAFFEEHGMKIDGSVRHGVIPDSVKVSEPLHVFESEPLPRVVDMMFKYSNNFVSEMLFKTLAAEFDSAATGSWEKGAALAMQWWRDRGLPGEPIIKNGSGMGNTNRYSAAQIVAVLEYVWNRKDILPEFLSALSVAGVDGTLKERFSGSPLKGIVRAKTGTLNNYGVSTLAGYILTPSATYAFAILFDGAGAAMYRHWDMQEKMLESAFAGVTE